MYCTDMATRNESTVYVDGPPGATWSSTMPMRATVLRDATKPPTLTIPLALPRRVGGLKVRARSNPTIEPGPPTASTTTRTTRSHSGARPGQSSTTAQIAMMEPTIHRIRVDREYGQRVTNPPISGLVTMVVTVM